MSNSADWRAPLAPSSASASKISIASSRLSIPASKPPTVQPTATQTVTSIQPNPWRRNTLNAISDSTGVIDERKLIAATAQSVAGTVAGAQHTDDAWMTVSRQRKTVNKPSNPSAVTIATRPSKAEQPCAPALKQADAAPNSWLDMFPPLPAALQTSIVKKPVIPIAVAPTTSIKSATLVPTAKIPVSAQNAKKSEHTGKQHEKPAEKHVQKPANAKTEASKSVIVPIKTGSAQPVPQSAVKLAAGAGKTIISAKMMNLKIKPLSASERAAVLAQKAMQSAAQMSVLPVAAKQGSTKLALLQRPKAMPQKRRKQRKTPLKRLILLARKQQIVRDAVNLIIQKATVALFGAELFKSKAENVSLSAFALKSESIRRKAAELELFSCFQKSQLVDAKISESQPSTSSSAVESVTKPTFTFNPNARSFASFTPSAAAASSLLKPLNATAAPFQVTMSSIISGQPSVANSLTDRVTSTSSVSSVAKPAPTPLAPLPRNSLAYIRKLYALAAQHTMNPIVLSEELINFALFRMDSDMVPSTSSALPTSEASIASAEALLLKQQAKQQAKLAKKRDKKRQKKQTPSTASADPVDTQHAPESSSESSSDDDDHEWLQASLASAKLERDRALSRLHRPVTDAQRLAQEKVEAAKRKQRLMTVPDRPVLGQMTSVALNQCVDELLRSLVQFQKRAIELQSQAKAKPKKRVVCGLREVLKGIRSKNIKLVIVAPNLETDGGGLDELVREVLAEAIVHQAHIVFALNRRKLGEAVAKKALIGVVGIRDDSGAHSEFEKVIQLSTAARESYAMMRNDPFRVLYQSQIKH